MVKTGAGAGGVVEHEAEERAGDDGSGQKTPEPDEVAASKACVAGDWSAPGSGIDRT